MKTLHLLISGRVQGVGFRDWLLREATQLSLSGWVRNKGSDTVEALISGTQDAVETCLERCWQGPPLAEVRDITATQAPPAQHSGFIRLSSVAPGG